MGSYQGTGVNWTLRSLSLGHDDSQSERWSVSRSLCPSVFLCLSIPEKRIWTTAVHWNSHPIHLNNLWIRRGRQKPVCIENCPGIAICLDKSSEKLWDWVPGRHAKVWQSTGSCSEQFINLQPTASELVRSNATQLLVWAFLSNYWLIFRETHWLGGWSTAQSGLKTELIEFRGLRDREESLIRLTPVQ